MDGIFTFLKDASESFGGANSFSDRLNSKYSALVLVIFALLTTTRQYISEPISCWCPSDFTEEQVDYVNKVCWTTSTYYLPESIREIPKEFQVKQKVSYYQWIPLMAVGQAVMFLIPNIMWGLLNKKSGIAVNSITNAAQERHKIVHQSDAEKIMEFMIKTMGKFLKELSWDRCLKYETQKNPKDGDRLCPRPCWMKLYIVIYGNYLTCLYVAIKIVYIVNVIFQIILLNAFLQTNFNMYGIETMSRMIRGEDWTTSHRFPRIAMCNFIIRAMGENMHRYTVQCAIPINLIHEIFYIFLWFWLAFLFIITSCSLFSWIFLSFPKINRITFVRNKLYADGSLKRRLDEQTEALFVDFVQKYLRRDGCFIARLVARNTGDVVAADLLGGLWRDFVPKVKKFQARQSTTGHGMFERGRLPSELFKKFPKVTITIPEVEEREIEENVNLVDKGLFRAELPPV